MHHHLRLTLRTLLLVGLAPLVALADERPNILWVTAEDMSPELGCYGDTYAWTPNLDRFAARSVRYTHAFATTGVCAPARSTIITGMYPTSIGTHHMRCVGRLPDSIRGFPEYLRREGYYCTNNSKTDYNFRARKETWDESSNKAHWRNRPPGKHFFAVFNLGTTHESQIWAAPEVHKMRRQALGDRAHDPAHAPVPPYHPDTPNVRRDLANHYDNVSVMDGEFQAILNQLHEDGLADNTIVFFYSDHGTGLPRSKRWLYDTSLRVPLIVHFPEKFKHFAPVAAGQTTERLVSFVDFAPTVLSLAGVKVPHHMQGHAFLGEQAAEPRKYIYGFRDRMDERHDMIRCVRDERYKYIRNYRPDKPYFLTQHLEYAMRTPTLRDWHRLHAEGKLDEVQERWMQPTKPVEELYDTVHDPYEVNNLAVSDSPEHREALQRLREEHRRWVMQTLDLGFLPEAEMRSRAVGTTEYEWARREGNFPLQRIAQTAWMIDQKGATQELYARLKDGEPAVRYWALLGIKHRTQTPTSDGLSHVQRMLRMDGSWDVRVAAADLLIKWRKTEGVVETLGEALNHESDFVRVAAAQVVDLMDGQAAELLPRMKELLKDPSEYVMRIMEKAIQDLEHKP